MSGIDTLEDYAATKSSIQKEIDLIENEISSIKSESNTTPELSLRESIRQTLETLHSDAPVSKKYDAVNSIIDRCTFDKQNMLLSIVYRYEV